MWHYQSHVYEFKGLMVFTSPVTVYKVFPKAASDYKEPNRLLHLHAHGKIQITLQKGKRTYFFIYCWMGHNNTKHLQEKFRLNFLKNFNSEVKQWNWSQGLKGFHHYSFRQINISIVFFMYSFCTKWHS